MILQTGSISVTPNNAQGLINYSILYEKFLISSTALL